MEVKNEVCVVHAKDMKASSCNQEAREMSSPHVGADRSSLRVLIYQVILSVALASGKTFFTLAGQRATHASAPARGGLYNASPVRVLPRQHVRLVTFGDISQY